MYEHLEARDINEPSKKWKKVDQAIAVINYIIKKRKKKIERISSKLELSENEKIFIGEELDLIKNVEVLVGQCKNEFYQITGKIPPTATDLEEHVLGACILQSEPPAEGSGLNPIPPLQRVRLFLKPEHFYHARNQLVYQALLSIDNSNLVAVVTMLRKTGHLEIVGGAHYVASLSAGSVSSANVEYHARVIVEMAMKRELIILASQMIHDGYEDSTDCFEMLENAENEFLKIKSWIR